MDPSGRMPGFDHQAHHRLGDIAGGGGGLGDGRHAGNEGRGELLQHAPDREVEGVDLCGDAGNAGVDVLAGEGAVAGEHFHGPVEDDVGVRQFAPALGGEGEQHADAAVDVHHRVDLGGAGAVGDLVELLAAAVEECGKFLQLQCPLVQCQLAQFALADGAAVFHDLGQVQAVAVDRGQGLTGVGIQHGGSAGRIGRGPPGVLDEAGNEWSHGSCRHRRNPS